MELIFSLVHIKKSFKCDENGILEKKYAKNSQLLPTHFGNGGIIGYVMDI